MNQNHLLRHVALLLFPISAGIVLASVQNPLRPWFFIAGAAGIFLSMLLLTNLCRERNSLRLALLLALLVRLLFVLYYPPAVDVTRYIWEGLIQHHGFNPFVIPPASELTAHLRNDLWQGVIFKEMTTIYWPFAQMLFRAATVNGPSYLAMKLMVSFFDLLTIGLLIHLARKKNHPLRYVLLYALNPLVLIFTSGHGHIETIVASLILAGLALSESRYRYLAYTALSCAILTKMYAIILLPFFIRNLGLRPLVFLFFPLLLCIPYSTDIFVYFNTPTTFASHFSHNGLFQTVIKGIFGLTNIQALLTIAVVLGTALAAVFFLTPSLLRASCSAIGLMLVFLPTVHPWYFLLITPYLVFFRQRSWLSLHLTSIFLIFYFNPTISGPIFHHKTLLMTWEYLPFLGLAAYELIRNRKHWPALYPHPGTVSVVIPVRNEEDLIADCIKSVQLQNQPCQIIVADGGSTDRTLERAVRYPGVVTCSCEPGRGVQIADGIRHASGDIIVVLHADSRLTDGALKRMLTALQRHPDAAGGAMDAIYDSPLPRFRLIALLNNFRARFTGIAFGDQAQFFHRAALPQGFPEYRLMEDIELSMRLKEHGTLLFIPGGVRSSSRRWNSTGYLTNFISVIWLTGAFLFLRAFGLVHNQAEWFYQRYYRQVR